MGLRTRIKNLIKDRLKNVRALASVIHEEANYPGRPQPHVAAKNPLYNGGDVESTPSKNAAPTNTEAEALAKAGIVDVESKGGDFWYLRGDNEGWADPNPGKKKS
ncbi:MAG: hypothetical protein VX278_23770 [Myxococcota bacterium]|nr:hypothetical protein [Myxococcota bacterium]